MAPPEGEAAWTLATLAALLHPPLWLVVAVGAWLLIEVAFYAYRRRCQKQFCAIRRDTPFPDREVRGWAVWEVVCMLMYTGRAGTAAPSPVVSVSGTHLGAGAGIAPLMPLKARSLMGSPTSRSGEYNLAGVGFLRDLRDPPQPVAVRIFKSLPPLLLDMLRTLSWGGADGGGFWPPGRSRGRSPGQASRAKHAPSKRPPQCMRAPLRYV